uniref:UDENN domain-containing protein n=1 Tax=Sinocyclocheilus grahami TaxID=75366 RepID=A0A672KJZ4_SINGR
SSSSVLAHSQRLVSVQSMLRQTGRYRTLERDLMELQERKLFEYFLVVALHKTKAGVPYLPEVTQQFPLKLERSFKFMREAEDQLKVIPQFCFPDAKDWAPVDNFPSETFSFVLTGEDGSRRFGYCRRLLPSGKGRRLPEVYCIVSRLGCFELFSKVIHLTFELFIRLGVHLSSCAALCWCFCQYANILKISKIWLQRMLTDFCQAEHPCWS